MNPEKILKQIKDKEIILLDVREKYEWDEGHIPGAKHIPLGNLNAESTKEIPKNMPVYTYCRSGGRAGVAESILQDLGFEKAQNMGGIIEWQDEGGEVVK